MSRRRAIAVAGFWALLLAACLVRPAQATDTVVYYHTDALRSVAVETNSSGAVIERTHYAPYGQVLNRPLRDGPGYTGHREDANTGLVYMQQRYYDPESGRFLSADPVQVGGNGESFNRYAYANDNPYRYTDPDGRCTGSHIKGGGCDSPALHVIFINPSDSSASVLQHLVKVSYASGTSDAEKASANSKISSVTNLLNANANKFTYAEKQKLRGISEIHVDPSASRSSVDVATGTFIPNAKQLQENTARFATDFAHDAYHIYLYQAHLPYAGAHAEAEATQFQLQIGGKIGLDSWNTTLLQRFLMRIDQNTDYWDSPVRH